MSSTVPLAWELHKVGDGSEGERFTLKFLEYTRSVIWVGGYLELTYEQARREALGRSITSGAFDVAVDRERLRFTRTGIDW